MNNVLGYLISGSLTDGFMMRITPHTPFEELKTGKFVSITGKRYTFFSLITDLRLEVTHPDILLFPPTRTETLLQEVVNKRGIYAVAHLKPMLMLEDNHICAVKTIPPHFARVHETTQQQIAQIFGDETDTSNNFFSLGTPLDMQVPVCINLERLTERSNGIFGKTGTGKTFLTRLVLAGLIKQEKAVNVIFDMHSEYGLQARKEGAGHAFVKGLKTLFPDKVAIFSLDPTSTRRRGGSPDVTVTIPYQSIQVDDMLSLQDELNLHATAVEAAYLIAAKHKRNWLSVLLNRGGDLKELAQEVGAHPESVAALYRKLKRIEKLPFFYDAKFIPSSVEGTGVHYDYAKASTHKKDTNVVDQMIEYIDKEMHIIIEFGNFTSTFCYLLIANIITRRIHTAYVQKTEQFLGSHKKEDEPKKLMITVEEAHKFLNPSAARQTIFGTIAREMRKYYVSLLVVDQRPSGIDAEVLSQIGTKIIAQLSDATDIQAVLTGVSNAQHLRTILSSLDSKKQALLLGHAVPMPVVIKTREYDEKFYAAMNQTVSPQQAQALSQEIF